MFFNQPDFDLESSEPPTFGLCPEGDMQDALRRDYRAMSTMIFGAPPGFEEIIEEISGLERLINAD